jgi:hypothetical protein
MLPDNRHEEIVTSFIDRAAVAAVRASATCRPDLWLNRGGGPRTFKYAAPPVGVSARKTAESSDQPKSLPGRRYWVTGAWYPVKPRMLRTGDNGQKLGAQSDF